jgi:hypothetical protein
VAGAQEKNHQHHKGQKKTAENLLARNLHLSWFRYSGGML